MSYCPDIVWIVRTPGRAILGVFSAPEHARSYITYLERADALTVELWRVDELAVRSTSEKTETPSK
jgi:hypothetical protein